MPVLLVTVRGGKKPKVKKIIQENKITQNYHIMLTIHKYYQELKEKWCSRPLATIRQGLSTSVRKEGSTVLDDLKLCEKLYTAENFSLLRRAVALIKFSGNFCESTMVRTTALESLHIYRQRSV